MFPIVSISSPRFGIPQGRAGRNGFNVSRLVFHQISQDDSIYVSEVVRLVSRAQLRQDGETHYSVHYAIGQSANIWNFVDPNNVAWGTHGLQVGGFEVDLSAIHIGLFGVATPTDLQTRATLWLVSQLSHDYSIEILPENVVAHSALDDRYFCCFGKHRNYWSTLAATTNAVIRR